MNIGTRKIESFTPKNLLPYLGKKVEVNAVLLGIERDGVCRIGIIAYRPYLRQGLDDIDIIEQEIVCNITDITRVQLN